MSEDRKQNGIGVASIMDAVFARFKLEYSIIKQVTGFLTPPSVTKILCFP